MDKSKGFYLSFRQLCERESIEKALVYVNKCIQMKGIWVEWDPMWEHHTFFVVERSWSSEFARAWAFHVESSPANEEETSSAAQDIAAMAAAHEVAPRPALANASGSSSSGADQESKTVKNVTFDLPTSEGHENSSNATSGKGNPDEGTPKDDKKKTVDGNLTDDKNSVKGDGDKGDGDKGKDDKGKDDKNPDANKPGRGKRPPQDSATSDQGREAKESAHR